MKKTLYFNNTKGILYPFNIVTKEYTKIFHENGMGWSKDYDFPNIVEADVLILEYK